MNKDYLYFRELYHHGIKGQKWGVRNEKEETPQQRKRREYYENTTAGKEFGRTFGKGAAITGAAWLGFIGENMVRASIKSATDPKFKERFTQFSKSPKVSAIMYASLASLLAAGLATSAAVGAKRAKYAKQVQAQAKQKS